MAGESIATLMRTPGHDLELAAGWLTVESGVRSAADLIGLRQCRTDDDLALRAADGASGRGIDQVHLALRPGVEPPRPRAWVTGAACGVCSADVLDLQPAAPDRAAPAGLDGVAAGVARPAGRGAVAAADLRPDRFAARGRRWPAPTATCWWCARTSAGTTRWTRCTVGRCCSDRLPATDLLLVVSGRVSFEIVQKAVAAGAAGIVAVSAPSDLAVDLAREHDLLLAGMVRSGRLNLYSGTEWVTGLDRADWSGRGRQTRRWI